MNHTSQYNYQEKVNYCTEDIQPFQMNHIAQGNHRSEVNYFLK